MNSDIVVFLVLSLIAISSALGMMFSRNAVYSALFLVLNFITVAVFYLLLGAPFIAMSQITVYAGAFVIMLLGAENLAPSKSLPWQKPLAYILAFVLVVESVYLVISRAQVDKFISSPEASLNSMDNLREMAMTLFNQYLLPFEITSILLLVAMVGAIVLTKQEKGEQK
jgi:NADH-quinone oxidoreductase subunit J